MTLDRAIAVLRQNREALNARHVLRAAVFGSVARGEQRPDSDVDVLVELDPEAGLSMFDFAAVQRLIGELMGGEVDVISHRGLRPQMRALVQKDAVYAF